MARLRPKGVGDGAAEIVAVGPVNDHLALLIDEEKRGDHLCPNRAADSTESNSPMAAAQRDLLVESSRQGTCYLNSDYYVIIRPDLAEWR